MDSRVLLMFLVAWYWTTFLSIWFHLIELVLWTDCCFWNFIFYAAGEEQYYPWFPSKCTSNCLQNTHTHTHAHAFPVSLFVLPHTDNNNNPKSCVFLLHLGVRSIRPQTASWQSCYVVIKYQLAPASKHFAAICVNLHSQPVHMRTSINAWRRSNARCKNTLHVRHRSHILLTMLQPFESECDPSSEFAAKAKALTVSVALIERDRGAACLYSQLTCTLA